MKETITVEAIINAPMSKVWEKYTDEEAVKVWNAVSEDWHTPTAVNDLTAGGSFKYRMEAKDGSEGFDFEGVYDEVIEHQLISYSMTDGRQVKTTFESKGDSTRVVVTFDPETENTHELQRSGWQAILDNFKKYVEGN